MGCLSPNDLGCDYARMKRITIKLPNDLVTALEQEAQRRQLSVSQIARGAFEQRLSYATVTRELAFAGLGGSGDSTTARDAEEILATEWDAADC